MQEQYVSEAKLTIETLQYINERAMMFETFFSKLVQAVDDLEKRGRGMHNADVVEIIWHRVSNNELIQYLTALKVHFQRHPCNYRELIKDTACQVLSIGVDTFQKAS